MAARDSRRISADGRAKAAASRGRLTARHWADAARAGELAKQLGAYRVEVHGITLFFPYHGPVTTSRPSCCDGCAARAATCGAGGGDRAAGAARHRQCAEEAGGGTLPQAPPRPPAQAAGHPAQGTASRSLAPHAGRVDGVDGGRKGTRHRRGRGEQPRRPCGGTASRPHVPPAPGWPQGH